VSKRSADRFTGPGTGMIEDDSSGRPRVRQVLAPPLSKRDLEAIKKWFVDYTTWMRAHPHGIAARDRTNNHGTWRVIGCIRTFDGRFRKRSPTPTIDFQTVVLPNQEAADGRFPHELGQTRPYGYSLFNLE
jgi:hypothetical protein